MFVLSEENNNLLLSFAGFDDCYVLDSYDENRLFEIYDDYNKKMASAKMEYRELFCDTALSVDEHENMQVVIDFDLVNDFNLIRNFIDKIKSIDIIIYVKDNKKLFNFISSLNEDELDNVSISYQFDSDAASVKEYKSMISKINDIVNIIKSFNLSDLETIMVVYDIVKSYKYKEVSNDNPSLSRTLHNIVLNDSCVCVGFSNYFNFLLHELGIDSFPIVLGYKNIKLKHQRSVLYVKDDKYDVEGIYMFDPTFDCNKGNKYINNYDYFLQSVSYFKRISKTEYVDESGIIDHDIYGILDISNDDLDDMSFIESARCFKTICYLNRMIGISNDYTNMFDINKNKKDIKVLKKYMCREIGYKNFIRLLYNIKKIEQEMGIVDDYTKNEIINTAYKRYINMSHRLNDKNRLFNYEIGFALSDFNELFDGENNDFIKNKIKK